MAARRRTSTGRRSAATSCYEWQLPWALASRSAALRTTSRPSLSSKPSTLNVASAPRRSSRTVSDQSYWLDVGGLCAHGGHPVLDSLCDELQLKLISNCARLAIQSLRQSCPRSRPRVWHSSFRELQLRGLRQRYLSCAAWEHPRSEALNLRPCDFLLTFLLLQSKH